MVPNSKGPNIHLIGAMSTWGIELSVIRRGSFRADTANAFIVDLIHVIQERGVNIEEVVFVVDNAPCHRRIEVGLEEYSTLPDGRPPRPIPVLVRLSPYSPMLNPIENIWSKVKAAVKRGNRVLSVTPPGLGEQRLQYLERLVGNAIQEITVTDCANCIQHVSSFFGPALNLENMPTGA